MADSFFFYDLETTGIRPSRDRIMQFGGQRTDTELNPIGQPVNISLRLTADILPAPEAIMLSGISPIKNQAEGISEAEFLEIFQRDIAIPGTIFTGFNNLRFDDEFIRYLNYRNFYDAYSWHWQNLSSRWDILDVVRMTRALRPDGINWPFDGDKPINKLESLTTANKLSHVNAHDALSDALATIDVARLIRSRQPKLFSYLLSLRKKATVAEVVNDNPAFVYTSSHFPSDNLHTTIVSAINVDQSSGSALVFDLRNDPLQYSDMSSDELAALWAYDPDLHRSKLPVKTMKLNRCPAIAPLSVLDEPSISRLNLDMDEISANQKALSGHRDELAAKLKQATKKLDDKRDEGRKNQPRMPSSDERLYDRFIPSADSALFPKARSKGQLSSGFEINFSDSRLSDIYSLYRARNYPEALSSAEQAGWRDFVRTKLFSSPGSNYDEFKLALKQQKTTTTDAQKLKLLEDLESYVKAIADDYAAN